MGYADQEEKSALFPQVSSSEMVSADQEEERKKKQPDLVSPSKQLGKWSSSSFPQMSSSERR